MEHTCFRKVLIMASLYSRSNGVYYLAVTFQGKRIIRSLGTRSKSLANELVPILEREMYHELLEGKKKKNISFKELVGLYLDADHRWKASTHEINTRLLGNFLTKGLPENKTTRAMTVRVVNACNNWGKKNSYIQDFQKLEGGNDYDARDRVFTKDELDLLFENITPYPFNQFVQFAYYSGARSGEIRRISRATVFSNYMIVDGKSGRRIVRLASQARKILDQNPQWDYTANYIQLTWRRNIKRLGLEDARMHDLRRTFGYNLIKQGRPIYEVSKLLGHSSVTTTERHYAPLMATEIEEFIL